MQRLLKHLLTTLLMGACLSAGAQPSTPSSVQPSTQPSTQPPVRIALIESLSGPFANAGEAVFRNLVWATERVNARGGVKLAGGARNLMMERYDSKGQNE